MDNFYFGYSESLSDGTLLWCEATYYPEDNDAAITHCHLLGQPQNDIRKDIYREMPDEWERLRNRCRARALDEYAYAASEAADLRYERRREVA
jgi:hypothetical protein